MTYMHRIPFILLTTSLACASSGVPVEGTGESVTRVAGLSEVETRTGEITSNVLDAPIDRVWVAVQAVYEDFGIELNALDHDLKRIGNTQLRPYRIDGTRLSRFLDCGRGITATPNADRYEVILYILSSVTEVEGGRSQIRTELNANAKPRDVGGHAVHCASKGTLETRIVEAVQEKLDAVNP